MIATPAFLAPLNDRYGVPREFLSLDLAEVECGSWEVFNRRTGEVLETTTYPEALAICQRWWRERGEPAGAGPKPIRRNSEPVRPVGVCRNCGGHGRVLRITDLWDDDYGVPQPIYLYEPVGSLPVGGDVEEITCGLCKGTGKTG